MDSHNPRLHRLYLAKSMKELNNMVEEIPSANPKLLVNSAQKVLKQAYVLEDRNDEEKAYVLFMRYFSIVATIQKQTEYKRNKKYYDSLMDPKTTSKVITRAETLHKSLERRYDLLNTAVTSERIEEKKFIHNIEEHNEAEKRKHQEAREAVEEKRKQEKARKGINEDEGTITCQKLYCLVKEKCSSFLILDIRPHDHFNETRMKINNVISIPEELIKPGLTAGRIGSELSHHPRAMWLSLRHKVDYLIICDWDIEEPPLTQPINTLIDAMLRWDPGKQYASRPWVLKGGFEMWRLMYPIHTTNPQFKRPAPVKEVAAEDLDDLDFEYPDLDQGFNKTPIDNTPGGNNINGWDGNNGFEGYGIQHGSYGSQPTLQSGYGGPPVQRPLVNRGLKPSMSNDDAPNNNFLPNSKNTERNYDMRANLGANVNSWDHKDTNKLADQNRAEVGPEPPPMFASVVPVIPSRSLKPEVALASLAANKTVMDAEQQLLEESVAVEEHALEKMRQKEETTNARQKAQDESTRHKLQETEDRLNIEIESLKSKSQMMEDRYSQVQQQNKELWHLVNQVLAGQVKNLNIEGPAASDAKLDPQEQQKQDNATKQSEEQLRQSELKRRAMQERVEKMRRERKEKERSLQTQEQTQKLKDKEDNETERGSPLRHPDKTDADARISRYISDGGEIYTAPLRRSPRSSPVRGGSNLKRSHSAFNISRLEDDESTSKTVQKPTIERSMKPLNVTPRRNNFNIARQRNFDPKIGKVGGNRSTGLKNLGNTCYMNSIIQCLSNTAVLVKYFVEDSYCDDINEGSRQHGELAEELGAVIKAMWCNQYRSIALWDLKNAVGKFHKPFQGYDQHDAHEFLIKLMDWLREDLNKVRQKIPPMKEQNHDGIPDYIAAGKIEVEFRRRDQSIIFASFHGLHRSSIECGTCKHRSLTFEPFSILTLSFPANGRSSLRDMLNHYYTDSNIEYTCSKCKKMRNCIRKTDIWKLPPLLIIHLNRFEHDVLMRKKQNYVDFPMENLDLSSYVGMNNNSSSRYSNFDLYGISNHYGTMDGGHYTAFCKSKGNNNWYKFDDHEVYELSRESVKTPAAYILFYETRQLSVNLNM